MKKIMIVDDSSVVRSAIRTILELFYVELDEAEDGQGCLEKVGAGSYDAVLLDWNMSVMNGVECLKLLRADPSNDELRILIVTGENDFSTISEALREGADEYIIKPFDQGILLEKLSLVGLDLVQQ